MGLLERQRLTEEGMLEESERCCGACALFSGVMGASADASSSLAIAGSGHDSRGPAQHELQG